MLSTIEDILRALSVTAKCQVWIWHTIEINAYIYGILAVFGNRITDDAPTYDEGCQIVFKRPIPPNRDLRIFPQTSDSEEGFLLIL